MAPEILLAYFVKFLKSAYLSTSFQNLLVGPTVIF